MNNGINCRECGISVCDYDRLSDGLCSKCKDTKENNMNEWKDLDIKNIPSDFFVNERYEIEFIVNSGEYHSSDILLSERTKIIDRIIINKPIKSLYRYKLKPLESKPIIIKSGDTKVAYFCGVDYLFIPTSQCLDVGYHWTVESFKDLIKEGTFKPISEIKITDDIAKLRPMVTTDYLSEPCILWAIDKTGISHYETGGCNVKALKLATVKDLTTK